jgi:hypothetical protein
MGIISRDWSDGARKMKGMGEPMEEEVGDADGTLSEVEE